MVHPGASAPASRKAQFKFRSPLYTKLTVGSRATTQLLLTSVDSHMLTERGFVKSSKKMCGVPAESITMLENCVLTSAPLTSAGEENGSPGPGECTSRIAEWNDGTAASPSMQTPEAGELQNSV